MKQKITIDGKTQIITLRDESHLIQVMQNKASITKNKKKTLERNAKYKTNWRDEV